MIKNIAVILTIIFMVFNILFMICALKLSKNIDMKEKEKTKK